MGNRRARELMLRQAEEAEWQRVHTEPRLARADAHPARGIGVRRLQLIVAPSFEESSVWEVRHGTEWQLIRPRVVKTHPELTVVGHDIVPFASAALVAYVERLVGLRVPLLPDFSGSGGLDGTRYELAVFGDMYSGWRFHWWSTWRRGWGPFVDLAMEMHLAFTAARNSDAEQGALPENGIK